MTMKDWNLFNHQILFSASLLHYPTSESSIIPRLQLFTHPFCVNKSRTPPPPPTVVCSLPQCWLLISMMAHGEDVDFSVLNEQIGTAECQLQRKLFVLRRPICLVNETEVQTRTAQPYGRDAAAAAALVLLRWGEINGQERVSLALLTVQPSSVCSRLCWHSYIQLNMSFGRRFVCSGRWREV